MGGTVVEDDVDGVAGRHSLVFGHGIVIIKICDRCGVETAPPTLLRPVASASRRANPRCVSLREGHAEAECGFVFIGFNRQIAPMSKCNLASNIEAQA